MKDDEMSAVSGVKIRLLNYLFNILSGKMGLSNLIMANNKNQDEFVFKTS